MKNARGISDIIATLVMILLTIVLIGVVWVVVSGIVTNSTKGATSGAQCFNSGIQITSATCSVSLTNCTVVIQRTTGTDTIGGVRLVFINASSSSNISDVNGSPATLGTLTLNNMTVGITNVSEVDASMYFTDAAQNKNVCSGVTKFTTVRLV